MFSASAGPHWHVIVLTKVKRCTKFRLYSKAQTPYRAKINPLHQEQGTSLPFAETDSKLIELLKLKLMLISRREIQMHSESRSAQLWYCSIDGKGWYARTSICTLYRPRKQPFRAHDSEATSLILALLKAHFEVFWNWAYHHLPSPTIVNKKLVQIIY